MAAARLSDPDCTIQEVATEVLRQGDALARIGEQVGKHEAENDTALNDINKQLREIVDNLSKRPPLWVTGVISVMASIIGLLGGALIAVVRMAG